MDQRPADDPQSALTPWLGTSETAYDVCGDLQLFPNSPPSFFSDALFGLEPWEDLTLPRPDAEYAGDDNSIGFASSAQKDPIFPGYGSDRLDPCGLALQQEPQSQKQAVVTDAAQATVFSGLQLRPLKPILKQQAEKTPQDSAQEPAKLGGPNQPTNATSDISALPRRRKRADQGDNLPCQFCFYANSDQPTFQLSARYSEARRQEIKKLKSHGGACLRCQLMKKKVSHPSSQRSLTCLTSESALEVGHVQVA
jgi:hypothetical protein